MSVDLASREVSHRKFQLKFGDVSARAIRPNDLTYYGSCRNNLTALDTTVTLNRTLKSYKRST